MALVSKNFSDIVTFSRASAATYWNSAGVLTTAATNAPRLDYDPSTLLPRGLLIEEQRVRLNTVAAAPVSPEIIAVTAQAYTISFYGTGSVALSGAHTATVVGTGASPTRTTLTFTPSAGNLTLTPSGTVQNMQLEAGSFATSPIVGSEGSQVTRSADVATINTLSPWYSATAGTLVVEAQKIASGPAGFPRLAQISDSTNNNSITILWAESLGRLYGAVNVGGAGQADIGNNGLTQTTVHKSALAYAANDFGISNDGATAVTDAAGSVPTVDRLYIGKDAGASYLNGWIRKITYYPTRKTNAELATLTA